MCIGYAKQPLINITTVKLMMIVLKLMMIVLMTKMMMMMIPLQTILERP